MKEEIAMQRVLIAMLASFALISAHAIAHGDKPKPEASKDGKGDKKSDHKDKGHDKKH